MSALCGVVVALLATTSVRADDPASLDSGFGDGGRVLLGGPDDPLAAATLALGPGPTIVAGGSAAAGYLAARFQSSGLPDLGFGTNGLARFPPAGAMARRIAALSDGRVLLVTGERTVVRLLADGRLDPAFGGGEVIVPGTVPLVGLVGEDDGSAVVIGQNHTLTRLGPDGSVDGSFGGEELEVQQRGAVPVTLLRRPAGGYAVVSDGDGEAAVTALDASGRLDRAFEGAGVVFMFRLVPNAAAIGPDGAIAVVGAGRCDSNAARATCPDVRRVGATGAIEPLRGTLPADLVTVDASGRIIAVGTDGLVGGRIHRYTLAGRPDLRFGQCGSERIPEGDEAVLSSVIALPSGRIVLGGRVGAEGSGSLFLMALRGTGSHDPDGPPSLRVRPDLNRFQGGRTFAFSVRSPERAVLHSRLILTRADARRLGVPGVQSTASKRLAPCQSTKVRLRLSAAVARGLLPREGARTHLILHSVVRNGAGRRVSRVRFTYAR